MWVESANCEGVDAVWSNLGAFLDGGLEGRRGSGIPPVCTGLEKTYPLVQQARYVHVPRWIRLRPKTPQPTSHNAYLPSTWKIARWADQSGLRNRASPGASVAKRHFRRVGGTG